MLDGPLGLPIGDLRVGLVVELHDVGGDIDGLRRPKHGSLRIAHVEDQGVAVGGGELLQNSHHLIAQLLHDFALLLVQIRLGILGIALQALVVGVDVAHELGLGLFAHGGAAFAQGVLQGRNVGLLLIEIGFLGRKPTLQIVGGLLPVLGLQNGVLHVNDGHLGRRLGMNHRGHAEDQSGENYKILLQAENS